MVSISLYIQREMAERLWLLANEKSSSLNAYMRDWIETIIQVEQDASYEAAR